MNGVKERSSPARLAAGIAAQAALAAVLSGLVWLVLTLSASGTDAAASGRAALLDIKPARVEVVAKAGEVVDAEFVITNVTNRDLRILGANRSCGACLFVGQVFPKTLAAGESFTLPTKLAVGRPGADGKFTQSIELLVNRRGAVPRLVLEATVPQEPLEDQAQE